MSTTVVWFFGRGLSIGCGLDWDRPTEWRVLSREKQISEIKVELAEAMRSGRVDAGSIRNLLTYISKTTNSFQRHLFVTTNWDYLLQQEILNLNLVALPQWLVSSHVFHINGTIEILENNDYRSSFILPEDDANQRMSSVEAEIVYQKIIWENKFVVVGMAFECEADKFLFKALGKIEDQLPIGESHWMLVNPDNQVLARSKLLIEMYLPCAQVECFAGTLDQWMHCDMSSFFDTSAK